MAPLGVCVRKPNVSHLETRVARPRAGLSKTRLKRAAVPQNKAENGGRRIKPVDRRGIDSSRSDCRSSPGVNCRVFYAAADQAAGLKMVARLGNSRELQAEQRPAASFSVICEWRRRCTARPGRTLLYQSFRRRRGGRTWWLIKHGAYESVSPPPGEPATRSRYISQSEHALITILGVARAAMGHVRTLLHP